MCSKGLVVVLCDFSDNHLACHFLQDRWVWNIFQSIFLKCRIDRYGGYVGKKNVEALYFAENQLFILKNSKKIPFGRISDPSIWEEYAGIKE